MLRMPRHGWTIYRLSLVLMACLLPACQHDHPGGAPTTRPVAQQASYPAHWWAPVPREGAPSWEILPQEAGDGEVILSKRNELGLLSNFAPTPFFFHRHRYASLEGFWQAMKYPESADDPRATFAGITWPYTREQVTQLTGFDAKRAGDVASQNMKKMNITWVSFEGERFEYRPETPGRQYQLIVEATREKVRQNPDVQRVLLATGNLVLKPDHHQEPNPPAAWRYYDILMTIRADIRARTDALLSRPGQPATTPTPTITSSTRPAAS